MAAPTMFKFTKPKIQQPSNHILGSIYNVKLATILLHL